MSQAAHGKIYFGVFLALCLLTVLSVVADLLEFADRRVLVVIVLSVATAKASCVLLYFMHLRFELAWKYLLVGPTLVLAASLPLALLSDISFHYYTNEAPQLRQLQLQQQHAAEPHSGVVPAVAH